MIFKTKNYYKNKINELSIENLKLSMENNIIKNENERLKLKHYGSIQIGVETDYINPSEYDLRNRLKCKVLKEIEKNFDEYVEISPIIDCPRECKCKQYATILIERKNYETRRI